MLTKLFLVLCLATMHVGPSHFRTLEQLGGEIIPFGTSQGQPPVKTSVSDAEVEVTSIQIVPEPEVVVTSDTSKSKGNTQEPVIKPVIKPVDHPELNDKYFYDTYLLNNNELT